MYIYNNIYILIYIYANGSIQCATGDTPNCPRLLSFEDRSAQLCLYIYSYVVFQFFLQTQYSKSCCLIWTSSFSIVFFLCIKTPLVILQQKQRSVKS